MVEVDDVSKIIGLILTVSGAIGLIFGIMSFFGSEPNAAITVGGAISLIIGITIAKVF